MAVYVDGFRSRVYAAHMIADTRGELDAMAKRVGLGPGSRQRSGKWHEHYDLTPRKRALAVAHGAVEITSRQAVVILRAKERAA